MRRVRRRGPAVFRFLAAILLFDGLERGDAGVPTAAMAQPTERGMRLFMVATAAALLTVPAVPAYSQVGLGGNKQMPKAKEEKKDEKTPEQRKAEEKAYKDAITRIPDQKFDPWGKVR
jgi:hypothetical protein